MSRFEPRHALADRVEVERVGALAAVKLVPPQPSDKHVLVLAAVEDVVALAAVDIVIAVIPIEPVVPVPALQPIVAVDGREGVVAVMARELVRLILEVSGESR
jgi:hypothetical protein